MRSGSEGERDANATSNPKAIAERGLEPPSFRCSDSGGVERLSGALLNHCLLDRSFGAYDNVDRRRHRRVERLCFRRGDGIDSLYRDRRNDILGERRMTSE